MSHFWLCCHGERSFFSVKMGVDEFAQSFLVRTSTLIDIPSCLECIISRVWMGGCSQLSLAIFIHSVFWWEIQQNPTFKCLSDLSTSLTAKFYCKMHYTQRQSSTHLGRLRRRMVSIEKLYLLCFQHQTHFPFVVSLRSILSSVLIFGCHFKFNSPLCCLGWPKPCHSLVSGQQELLGDGQRPDPTPRYPGFLA